MLTITCKRGVKRILNIEKYLVISSSFIWIPRSVLTPRERVRKSVRGVPRKICITAHARSCWLLLHRSGSCWVNCIASVSNEICTGCIEFLLEPLDLPLKEGDGTDAPVDRVPDPGRGLKGKWAHSIISLVRGDLIEELGHIARTKYLVNVSKLLSLLRWEIRCKYATGQAFPPKELASSAWRVVSTSWWRLHSLLHQKYSHFERINYSCKASIRCILINNCPITYTERLLMFTDINTMIVVNFSQSRLIRIDLGCWFSISLKKKAFPAYIHSRTGILELSDFSMTDWSLLRKS